jgi:diacylglycerol kinase family enzyme
MVPAGTTNVLQRLLGMPRRPRAAAEAIVDADGAVRRVRVLTVDTTGPAGRISRVATFAVGIGFDAEAVRESERRPLGKVGLGPLHYARSALRVASAFRDRLDTLRVESAGETADAVGLMVQVHDEYTFLGNWPMRLGPPPGPMAASVRRVRPIRMIRVATRAVTRRRIDRVGGVRLWRGFSTLNVRAEPEAWIQADGEIIGQVSDVEMTPAERGLVVVAGVGVATTRRG